MVLRRFPEPDPVADRDSGDPGCGFGPPQGPGEEAAIGHGVTVEHGHVLAAGGEDCRGDAVLLRVWFLGDVEARIAGVLLGQEGRLRAGRGEHDLGVEVMMTDQPVEHPGRRAVVAGSDDPRHLRYLVDRAVDLVSIEPVGHLRPDEPGVEVLGRRPAFGPESVVLDLVVARGEVVGDEEHRVVPQPPAQLDVFSTPPVEIGGEASRCGEPFGPDREIGGDE